MKIADNKIRYISIKIDKELNLNWEGQFGLVTFIGKFNSETGYRPPVFKIDQIDDVVKALKELKRRIANEII